MWTIGFEYYSKKYLQKLNKNTRTIFNLLYLEKIHTVELDNISSTVYLFWRIIDLLLIFNFGQVSCLDNMEAYQEAKNDKQFHKNLKIFVKKENSKYMRDIDSFDKFADVVRALNLNIDGEDENKDEDKCNLEFVIFFCGTDEAILNLE